MKKLAQNKFLGWLITVLLIANLGLILYFFVFAKKNQPERAHPVSDFVKKELGFNADQLAKFDQLRDQHKKTVKPVFEDMKHLKDSLYTLLRQPGTDSGAAQLTHQIGERQEQWELMVFHHFQKVREICDSNQLPKFDSLVHRLITRGPWMRRDKSQNDQHK